MQQSSFFCWHVHHRRIVLEWCYDYDERAEYIRTEKPPYERALRLRLFQPVKGQLPQEVVETGNAFGEAWKANNEAKEADDKTRESYRETRKAWFKTGKARFRLWKKSYRETRKAFDEALKAYDEAGEAYNEALKAFFETQNTYREALSSHKDEIEALHLQECLHCPWDGMTIFPAA